MSQIDLVLSHSVVVGVAFVVTMVVTIVVATRVVVGGFRRDVDAN